MNENKKDTVWRDSYGFIRTGWALLFGLGGFGVLVVVVCTWIISVNGKECTRICSLNGHESAHDTWSEGCLCKDKDGVYNPYDERPAP